MSGMSGKTWDHWTRLALWPLDVACQLVYGEDPKGMPEDIKNLDIDGRPDSVNLYHQAIAAIKAGTLSTVFDLEVRPAEFLAWAQGQGVPLLREFADIPGPPPAGSWPWGSYETKLLLATWPPLLNIGGRTTIQATQPQPPPIKR